MRVSNFIVSRNISIIRLNHICDYLFLPEVRINSKASEEIIRLWDLALNDNLFDEWLKMKIKFEKIQTENANRIVKELKEISNIESYNIEHCERIVNSYLFLIKKSKYPTKDAETLSEIINSEKSLLGKISLLKNFRPYTETNKIKTKQSYSNDFDRDYESSYDPYENFHWGGLSGEEAYIGYWNTD